MTNNQKTILLIYLRYIGAAYLFIGTVASSQIYFFYGTLKPSFYLMPAIVATVLGTLLARGAVLKHKLKIKSDQFRAIADLAMEFTSYRMIDGQYDYVSPSCLTITGYSQDVFYANPNFMGQLIHEDDKDLWNNHSHHMDEGSAPEALDIRLISKSGEVVWISHLCTPVFDENRIQLGVRSTNMDITERKKFEQKYKQMAFYDPLTKLPNRRLLEQELQNKIDNAKDGSDFAVLFLDLSRFKNINDNFGHSFGDQLLVQLSASLSQLQDKLFISRFGGDEFVMLVPDVANDSQALEIARDIIAIIEEPIVIDDIELYVSGSIGISIYPRDGDNAETLISHADTAMYQTKGSGDKDAEIYSDNLGDHVKHFVSTESKIHKGLENNEFEIFYQPQINLLDKSIVGLEALIRWRNPVDGMIMPNDFIPVAEETGQIIELGDFVFETVLSDLKKWHESNIAVPVSINFSARQFTNHTYSESCLEKLQHIGFDASMIELEVTEQVFLGDLDHAIIKLNQFKEAGVSIALDDFGTGYSSLNYLKLLPIDTLKIDISFVRDLVLGNRSYNILKAILLLAEDLGLNSIAEGVETLEQQNLLFNLGCKLAQGFYYHKALPEPEINRLLIEQARKILINH
ncbi:MAG: EAL domain-containing protein [Gammaproteobacteria bacterium]|nr:EAL domain-containing protein [Gammaproteobacteria bacterium]